MYVHHLELKSEGGFELVLRYVVFLNRLIKDQKTVVLSNLTPNVVNKNFISGYIKITETAYSINKSSDGIPKSILLDRDTKTLHVL